MIIIDKKDLVLMIGAAVFAGKGQGFESLVALCKKFRTLKTKVKLWSTIGSLLTSAFIMETFFPTTIVFDHFDVIILLNYKFSDLARTRYH